MARIGIAVLVTVCCLAAACSMSPRKAIPALASIAGRAILLDGKPVEGAEVSGRHTQPDGSSVLVFKTTTDADGRFSVSEVPPGKKLWISVSKMYPGKELYSEGVHVTLEAGETRTVPDLKGGRMPPPMTTPANSQVMD